MRRVLLGMLAALALLALAGGGLWYANVLQERAQAEALAEARARWEQRPFEHYQLQWSKLMGDGTKQVRSFRSTFYDSVPAIFEEIAVFPANELSYPMCDRPILICHLHASYALDATYDPQLGHPLRVTFTTTAHPDWFNPRFWWLFVQHRWWNECRTWNCTTTYREVVTIDSLEPLPPDAD